MFEALIEKLILSYFGDYIENLDRNKLSLGLWSGSLTLEDIKINPKSINKFKLPFKFLFGKIKKLTLLIPWKENFSVPTQITIESIQIVLTATSDTDKWEYTDYNNYENKLYYLLQFSNERMLQLTQTFIEESKKLENSNQNEISPKEKQNSFWDGLIIKILDNLQVKFKNVHIRIEAPFDNNHTSLGVSLEEMFVVNTNEQWEEEFIDRNVNKNINIFKLLKISNFGIYLNPNEEFLIYNVYEENISCKSEKDVQGIIEEHMNKIFPEEEEKLPNMEYLIEPMSLTAKMTQRNDINIKENKDLSNLPKMLLTIELDKFNFDIQKEQYDCIIKIMNTINQYHQLLYDFNDTNKFKFFRPRQKLSDAIKNNENKSKIIRDWWKYAIRMIIGQLKCIKDNKKNIFKLPDSLIEQYKKDFEKLYKKYYLSKNDNKKAEELTEKELNQFNKILEITELKDLYIWSRTVIQDIFTERKKEEKKYNNSTYIGYILGTKFNEDELISKEEQNKIDEILTNEMNKAMKLIINNDLETKLQIDFILNEGSFKFTKYFNKQKITEGFEFQYKGFFFSTKRGEHFNEFNSKLDKINVYLFNIVNNNIVSIPITYKFLEQGGKAGQTKFKIKNNNNIESSPFLKKLKKNKNNNNSSNTTTTPNNTDSDSISYKYETFNSVHSDFDESEKEDISTQKYHRRLSSIKIDEFEENLESEYSDAEGDIQEKDNNKNHFIDDFKDKNKYFMTLFFRKNLYNTDDNINSKLNLYINVLHITYHQVFLERIINFFKVPLDEDLANKAIDKFEELKLGTQQTIIDNIYKKNIIQIYIEPRKILIPINKYDIKNSKLLLLDLGRIDSNNDYDTKMKNEAIDYSNYKEKYSLYFHSIGVNYYSNYEEMIKNIQKFEIISKMTMDLTFGFLNPGLSDEKYPLYKFFLNINSMNIDLNCYIYTIFISILHILKPTREIDLWSQLNTNKKEIRTNSKVSSFVLKKNHFYKKYQQYYAVLSGGYIYFYYDEAEPEYIAYFHLKNCTFQELEDNLCFKLISNYGSIELKLFDQKSYDNWKKNINDRITEMKISYKFQESEKINQENMQLMKENPKQIYFGAEINFNQVNVRLHNDDNNNSNKNNIFVIMNLSNLKALLSLRLFDSELHMDIQSLAVYDNLTQVKDFQTILTTEKKSGKNNKKVLDLNILMCEEKSDRYKNIQMDVNMIIGTCTIIWNPPIIKNIISFAIYNDIYKYKVKQELTNQNINMTNKDFISPGTIEIHRPKCNINTYTYMNIHSSFNEISIILIQPIYQIKFNELRFGPSFLDYTMKVDHNIIKGELGNTQLFDLCQYPFVIKNQKEFDQSKIKEIFGIKKNNQNNNNEDSSLIKFYYKSMNLWCPECKDNYTSEADIVINQSMLIFIYEQFMRFFYYFLSQFLGAFAPPEKVKRFTQTLSQIKPKKEKDIYFLKLNVVINSPQIILKPRYHMKEYFLIDLGDINVSAYYQKVFGRVRNDLNDYRWMTTYQIDMKNFSIKTQDNFDILDNSNIIANMHFINATEQDKILSETEFDDSYQFDIMIDNLNMNLRQIDLTNLLRCSDLNILYTDNKSEYYDYEKYENNIKKSKSSKEKKNNKIDKGDNDSCLDESDDDDTDSPKKTRSMKENLSFSNKKVILNNYVKMICYTLIKKISVKLYLFDDKNNSNVYKPFVDLILKETQTIFTKKLDSTNETRIITADMELLEIPFIRKEYDNKNDDDNSNFKILSEFTQNIITGEIEDYEYNNQNNAEDIRKYNKRKTFRESRVKEEKIFKTNLEVDNENNNINENLKINLLNNLNKKSYKNLQFTIPEEKDNDDLLYSYKSDLITNVENNNLILNSTSNFISRNKKRHSTVKITKNDNTIYNENDSEKLMNQIYTFLKKCVIIPYKEMVEKSTKIQTDILILIDSNREKSYQCTLNGFKLIMRIDIFQLCRYFFLEGFPFYDKTSRDLPNLFDPEEDNRPGMKIFIKLKHPIICFLTDDITNKDQELICITSEVTFGIKNDKMSLIKEELINKYNELLNKLGIIDNENDKNEIEKEIKKLYKVNNMIKCTLYDVCPFICDYKNLDNKNNENLFISKRKIMNDFDFSYISQYIINFIPE